jgi:hypothetical protein
MLYIASDREIPEQSVGRLTVQAVDAAIEAKLSSSLSKPFRRFVGVDGGCSCDFPSVVSEEPIAYYDGMFENDSAEERAHSVACNRSLLALIASALRPGEELQLYPAWADQESCSPKGRVDVTVQDVVPEEFFFNEHFLYVVSAR